MTRSYFPNVSIIIPCRNEEAFIGKCIDSLLGGTYPANKIEIIVVDGLSSDQSQSIVREYTRKGEPVRLIDNPKKITPCALNIGIRNSTSEVVILVGAHASYDEKYVELLVETLIERQCASVGGVIVPTGDKPVSNAIAVATATPFGVGNAHYRYSKECAEVDTVFGACVMRENLALVGEFNEAWVRNQDYEFNFRLRQRVGKIVLNPDAKCNYYCRETIPMLAKQYYDYGYWRFNTLREHPQSFSYRQAAPVGLCLVLAICAFGLLLGNSVFWIPAIAYLFANILVSSYLAINKARLDLCFLLPIAFTTIHVSWGLGFIRNSLSFMTEKFLRISGVKT